MQVGLLVKPSINTWTTSSNLALEWAMTDQSHKYLYGDTFAAYTDNNLLAYTLISVQLDAAGHH